MPSLPGNVFQKKCLWIGQHQRRTSSHCGQPTFWNTFVLAHCTEMGWKGCVNFLSGFVWLLLSKTCPLFSPALNYHLDLNTIRLAMIPGLPTPPRLEAGEYELFPGTDFCILVFVGPWIGKGSSKLLNLNLNLWHFVQTNPCFWS